MEEVIVSKRKRNETEDDENLIKKKIYLGNNFTLVIPFRIVEGANRIESDYRLGCALGGNIKWDNFINDFADMVFGATTPSIQVDGILVQMVLPESREELKMVAKKHWTLSKDALCIAARDYFYVHPEKMTGHYFEALPKDIQGEISEYIFPLGERVWLSNGTWIPIFDAFARVLVLCLFGFQKGTLSMFLTSDTGKSQYDDFIASIKKDPITGKYAILIESCLDDPSEEKEFETNCASIWRLLSNKVDSRIEEDGLLVSYETDLKTLIDILKYELNTSSGKNFDMLDDGLLNNLFSHLLIHNDIDADILHKNLLIFEKTPLIGIKDPIFIPLIEKFGSIIANTRRCDIAKFEFK